MTSLESKFEKAFAHIAFGLKEKLERPNPEQYHYGLLLRQGINMFSALAVEFSGMKGDRLKEYLVSLNETEMISKMFTIPVNEWFDGWNESSVDVLKNSYFGNVGALIYLNESEKSYTLTGECLDYLDLTEKDLSAIDEHLVFELMSQLYQDDYVYVRKFLITHPILKDLDRKEFLIRFNNAPIIMKIFEAAYEDMPIEAYHCPNCGWTMTFKGLQPKCCHRDCVDMPIIETKCKRIKPEYVYHLKIGVMRYIGYPGKAELEIEKICEKLKIKSELWPELDSYDIKVIFNNGTCWGIDAKTYNNPYLLAKDIENDNYFRKANIDKGYYVIPDKNVKRTVGYLNICNKPLANDEKFKCVSLRDIETLIRQENNR